MTRVISIVYRDAADERSCWANSFSDSALSQYVRVASADASVVLRFPIIQLYDACHKCRIETAGRQMIPNDSGTELKSGKLSTGMGGRFGPESAFGI